MLHRCLAPYPAVLESHGENLRFHSVTNCRNANNCHSMKIPMLGLSNIHSLGLVRKQWPLDTVSKFSIEPINHM